MDTFDLNIDTRELDAALTKLPYKLRSSIMRKALQAAGDVMLPAVIDHTPERTDEETPDADSLPPGILKASMTTQVIVPDEHGYVRSGSRSAVHGNPRVKVGPAALGKANQTGRVNQWVNNGWTLTGHASRSDPNAKHGKKGWKKGKEIRAIPGKHHMEAAFDESAEKAVTVFLDVLAAGLFGDENSRADENYGGEYY